MHLQPTCTADLRRQCADALAVTTLDLRNYREQNLPPCLAAYENVTSIDASDSGIRNWPRLSCLPRLRVLRLRNCGIRSFEQLGDMPSLQILDLSDNPISSWEDFPRLPRLEELVMVRAAISKIESFPYLPELRTVSLQGTPLFERCGQALTDMIQALSSPKLQTVCGIAVSGDWRRRLPPETLFGEFFGATESVYEVEARRRKQKLDYIDLDAYFTLQSWMPSETLARSLKRSMSRRMENTVDALAASGSKQYDYIDGAMAIPYPGHQRESSVLRGVSATLFTPGDLVVRFTVDRVVSETVDLYCYRPGEGVWPIDDTDSPPIYDRRSATCEEPDEEPYRGREELYAASRVFAGVGAKVADSCGVRGDSRPFHASGARGIYETSASPKRSTSSEYQALPISRVTQTNQVTPVSQEVVDASDLSISALSSLAAPRQAAPLIEACGPPALYVLERDHRTLRYSYWIEPRPGDYDYYIVAVVNSHNTPDKPIKTLIYYSASTAFSPSVQKLFLQLNNQPLVGGVAPPRGELSDVPLWQGDVLGIRYDYFGGIEGESIVQWLRDGQVVRETIVPSRLQRRGSGSGGANEADSNPRSSSNQAFPSPMDARSSRVSATNVELHPPRNNFHTHTIREEDVGAELACCIIPVRCDGRRGTPVLQSFGKLRNASAQPFFTDFRVLQQGKTLFLMLSQDLAAERLTSEAGAQSPSRTSYFRWSWLRCPAAFLGTTQEFWTPCGQETKVLTLTTQEDGCHIKVIAEAVVHGLRRVAEWISAAPFDYRAAEQGLEGSVLCSDGSAAYTAIDGRPLAPALPDIEEEFFCAKGASDPGWGGHTGGGYAGKGSRASRSGSRSTSPGRPMSGSASAPASESASRSASRPSSRASSRGANRSFSEGARDSVTGSCPEPSDGARYRPGSYSSEYSHAVVFPAVLSPGEIIQTPPEARVAWFSVSLSKEEIGDSLFGFYQMSLSSAQRFCEGDDARAGSLAELASRSRETIVAALDDCFSEALAGRLLSGASAQANVRLTGNLCLFDCLDIPLRLQCVPAPQLLTQASGGFSINASAVGRLLVCRAEFPEPRGFSDPSSDTYGSEGMRPHSRSGDVSFFIAPGFVTSGGGGAGSPTGRGGLSGSSAADSDFLKAADQLPLNANGGRAAGGFYGGGGELPAPNTPHSDPTRSPLDSLSAKGRGEGSYRGEDGLDSSEDRPGVDIGDSERSPAAGGAGLAGRSGEQTAQNFFREGEGDGRPFSQSDATDASESDGSGSSASIESPRFGPQFDDPEGEGEGGSQAAGSPGRMEVSPGRGTMISEGFRTAIEDDFYPGATGATSPLVRSPGSQSGRDVLAGAQDRVPLQVRKFKVVTAGSAVGEFTKVNISLNGEDDGQMQVSVVRFGSGAFKHPVEYLPVTYVPALSTLDGSAAGKSVMYAAEYKIRPFDAGFQLYVQVTLGKIPHIYRLTERVVGMDLSFYQICKRLVKKRWRFHGTVRNSEPATIQRAGREVILKFGRVVQARALLTDCYAKEYPERNIIKIHLGAKAFLLAMSSLTELEECYVAIMLNSQVLMKSYSELVTECQ